LRFPLKEDDISGSIPPQIKICGILKTVMSELPGPNFEELLFKYRYYLLIFLSGLILIGFGAFFWQNKSHLSSNNIEVLEGTTVSQETSFLVVEISGAVEKPGVYKLSVGSRIDDLLVTAGGLSADADRSWVEKNINRAAKISDGQKVVIQQSGVLSAENSGQYQNVSGTWGSGQENLVNINTASLSELDKLPGIGPVYGQNIIDHRPYSKIEDLIEKDVLKTSVFEKIKNLITAY
jgi:competence protein ComEA